MYYDYKGGYMSDASKQAFLHALQDLQTFYPDRYKAITEGKDNFIHAATSEQMFTDSPFVFNSTSEQDSPQQDT